MPPKTNPFNYLSLILNPAAFAGQQAANPGLWNIRPELFGTTEGPQQPQQQQTPSQFDPVAIEEAKGRNDLNKLAEVAKIYAEDQRRKDANNQALQNQINSRPGAAWGENGGSGPLRREQLANPQLEAAWAATPAWAKQSSLLTPEGMKNAVGVSQVQNPFVESSLPQGTTKAPIYQDGNKIGDGIFNAQTSALQAYGLATPASSMPANYSGQLPASYGQPIASQASRDYLGGLVREVGNGVPTAGVSSDVAAAMFKKNPLWSSYAQPQSTSFGSMLANLIR